VGGPEDLGCRDEIKEPKPRTIRAELEAMIERAPTEHRSAAPELVSH
jgi:hypothetical protein